MVVTANPKGSQAGEAVLQSGGNALDAALAAAFALNVVEPQSSGIGGSGFLLYYDGANLYAFEGRETAPAALPIDAFLDENRQPLGFRQASNGGLAVGVPGFLKMAKQAHKAFGSLEWHTLFQPAIALARDGFEASPRFRASIARTLDIAEYSPQLGLVQADGSPVAGIYKNPALAQTFTTIAADGIGDFYYGDIAANITRAVKANGGVMTLADLRQYQSGQPEVLCGEFLRYDVCGMGLPTGGTMGVLRTLELLQLQATDNKLGDIPTNNQIPARVATALAEMYEERTQWGNSPNTTHIAVVDSQGRIASLTASVGPAFGSLVASDGFILNGEMTDFNFKGIGANRIKAGAKPLSSQSPLIVFEASGKPVAVAGSAGGANIISYLVRVLVETLALGIHPAETVANPNYTARPSDTENAPVKAYVEKGFEGLANSFSKIELRQSSKFEVKNSSKFEVQQTPMTSGISLITRTADGNWLGVADPRREGIPLGGPFLPPN